MNNVEYWIWFSRIKGNLIKNKLLREYNYDINKIYNLNKSKLNKIEYLKEESKIELLEKTVREKAKQDVEYIEKNEIKIINICDSEYPQQLKNIYDPPITLYVKGNVKNLNKKSIAIVGCRESTKYGKEAAQYFSYNLSKNNYVIISGLAKGIDGYSHLGTMAAKGNTIAVIGTGIDIVYPKENVELQKRIIELNGTIVSEYPIGTLPLRYNFPKRNRLISGMSDAVLVIEAKEKSGTLITVDFALEQGKDVYVVPGNINSVNSIGTNRLIKEGARVATNIYDIVKDIKN